MVSRMLKLVDSDIRRRAAISHALSAKGFHVEPFEGINELAAHWPASGVILAEDRQGTLELLLKRMADSGNWLPVIGFSADPTTNDVVKAILCGAIDYLGWPFAAADVENAYRSAEASMATIGNV